MKLSKVIRIVTLVALTSVMLLGIALLVFSYADLGVADDMSGGLVLSDYDFSTISEAVVDDANRLARELFGTGQKYKEFVNQLLTSYMEAKDKDIVVLFNAGGWGWAKIDDIPGWRSILSGISSELESWGYESLLLNYQRTSVTWLGRLKESFELMNRYPSKARDLADRTEFLTRNIPEIRIVVAGESNGTILSDYTMKILKDNQQVFSIQTGSPFWYKPLRGERTLLLNDNGVCQDTFSNGDVLKILWASFKGWLGLLPEDDPGRVAYVLRAPGHDYSWKYPQVCSQITDFLKNRVLVKGG